MYKSFSAEDYKKHFDIPLNYELNGFIIFGTFRQFPYSMLKDRLSKLSQAVDYTKQIKHDFFNPIVEFKVNGKVYWFVVAYGGTMLSEWLNLACLFGSKKNILLGSCGGLLQEADTPDIIIPTHSDANESATRMYEPQANGNHAAHLPLSKALEKTLATKHKVWRGPTVTCQAMMAETWEDVQQWSRDGYYGVEMEAATVFAVSNHFKVKAAAALVIGDNLIQEKTVMDVNYEQSNVTRRGVTEDMFDAAITELIST